MRLLASLFRTYQKRGQCQKKVRHDIDAALFEAVKKGDYEFRAKRLISAGADVNAKDNNGKTVLMVASKVLGSVREIEIVNLLLSKGSDVNAKDNDGRTALMFASMENLGTEISKLLLCNGADVNAKDNFGATALMYASEQYLRPEKTRLLLSNGADVNARNNDGWTPLMWSLRGGPHEATVVKLLLSKGADVNARNNDGWTPLMYASNHWGRMESLQELLFKGVDINAETTEGCTALTCALNNGGPEVVEMLLSNGANIGADTLNNQIARIPTFHYPNNVTS